MTRTQRVQRTQRMTSDWRRTMRPKRSIVTVVFGVAIVAVALGMVATISNGWLLPPLSAESLNCNVSQYKAAPGLTAAVEQDSLLVSWSGQNGADVRARYAIDGGKPVVR